ncbi:uncharacterized protein LOC123307014 [Coccinella septempunctata]|uniref:uncharacterized protein LOC123307014 n=1 Tax=Coccinella septempunctata TaxID=41139 RepID=UPI001D05DBE2|nr:uncharacterized protein LOC123307014 [Coccinella septempunctata]
MNSSSGGEYTEMEIEDDGQWKKVRHKRKRSKNPNSPTQQTKKIAFPFANTDAIRSSSPCFDYSKRDNGNSNIYVLRQTTQEINMATVNNNKGSGVIQKGQQIKQYTPKTIHSNFSIKMKGIQNTEYDNLFYIMVNNEEIKDRIQMSDLWNTKNSKNKDVILKTKIGYLLKSNNDKEKLQKTLEELQQQKKILSFKETIARGPRREKTDPQHAYSVVLSKSNRNNTPTTWKDFFRHELPPYIIKSIKNKRKIYREYCKLGDPTYKRKLNEYNKCIQKMIAQYREHQWTTACNRINEAKGRTFYQ